MLSGSMRIVEIGAGSCLIQKTTGTLISVDLSGEEFRRDPEAIFSVFCKNAHKIAPGGSTNDNESFNNMVAAKAPKRCHFSATNNFASRVNSAVAQKKLGNSYLNEVIEKLGLSPGRECPCEAEKRDSKAKRKLEYSWTKDYKTKRLHRN